MTQSSAIPSARRTELLERAYRYALHNGLADVSLRPLAEAIGSSPRVLLFLFGSKDGLIRALLERARADELTVLRRADPTGADGGPGLAEIGLRVWDWLVAKEHRQLLVLWLEAYSRSLLDPRGPWADFARDTVRDWLAVLAAAQLPAERDTAEGQARRTLVLAILRGGFLDLLATGDVPRTTAAVRHGLAGL